MKIFVVVFISFIIFSCEEKQPISEDKFVLVYTDFMFAQDTSIINDNNLDSLRSEIFNRHNITADEYQQTLDTYNKIPQMWEAFFEKVITHIESLKSNSADSLNSSS